MSALESALPSSAGSLSGALKSALPNGGDLVTETATAAANGNSTACAGFLLAGDCTVDGKPQPLTLSLSLADLPGLPPLPTGTTGGSNQQQSPDTGGASNSPAASAGLPTSLPTSLPTALPKLGGSTPSPAARKQRASSSSSNPLAGFEIVVTLSGPEAACTAGPSGSSGSNFTATQNLAAASLDIQQGGKSVLPNGPISLKSGDILSQLPSLPGTSQLGEALTQALGSTPLSSAASPINLTINPGSTSGVGSGPSTTATAGELGLSAEGTQLFDVKGAQAKCGPNKAAVGSAPAPAKKTSSETPLGGGIQTDEGRSGSGADPALWAGVAGAAVVGGTASGLTMWRRRRNAL